MYTKIHKPSTSGESVYSNKGSAGRVINYFRSEELKETPEAIIKYQTDKGEMNYGEAIQNIDNQSKEIETGKVKFSALSFNLAAEEAQALAQGKQGDTRTKKERVEELTKKLMNEYAKSFPNKDLKEADLVYVAKVHEHRKKNGLLNKDDQTHIHVVVSNLTKDKKQFINPETGNKKQFNKSNFFNKSQKLTSQELGTAPPITKSLQTKFSKDQTPNIQSIKKTIKNHYYSPDGERKEREKILNKLGNNIKGLSEKANKITIVEMTPRKGNYFNNPENARNSADQIMNNYAKSLKAKGTKKEDLVYYYRINTEKGKNPSLEIVISNRNKDMSKSVGANPKSFDFKKFTDLNNQFNNEIEKKRNHISPTEKNIYVLNKKYNTGIDYKEKFENQWLGKESKEYKETKKMINDRYIGDRKISVDVKSLKSTLEKVEDNTQKALNKGSSILKRVFANQNQKDDYEINRAIKKRRKQEQGLTREISRELGK